jgi:hypothetical protein
MLLASFLASYIHIRYAAVHVLASSCLANFHHTSLLVIKFPSSEFESVLSVTSTTEGRVSDCGSSNPFA